jgi:mRNA interferase MazF
MRKPFVDFDQFDVVVVPFPFTDRLATKRRPALVLTKPEVVSTNRSIFAMITSGTIEEWPLDIEINDLQEAGLTVPCKIRFKVFTLDHEQVVRKIGKLSKKDSGTVAERLKLAFGLATT